MLSPNIIYLLSSQQKTFFFGMQILGKQYQRFQQQNITQQEMAASRRLVQLVSLFRDFKIKSG